ncbi:MAG: nitroreductase [Pseudomonadota bacterium]
MKVSDALTSRITCRAFLPDAPDEAMVRRLLETARWSPSGGNLQPWRVYALAGPALDALKDGVAAEMATTPMGHPPSYEIYPAKLKDPYNARRRKCGEDMYATIGVTREDKPGRYAQFRRNFEMFGAPIGLFVYLDRQMGPPQWSDVGMFLQSLMLAAREEGLHTAPQEAWAMWESAVRRATGAPEEEMLFCGVGLGWMDESAPINALRTDRATVDEFAVFAGFGPAAGAGSDSA